MNNFISYPSPALENETQVPGDKSISHRAVIFGALAKGTSIINGFLDGQDCLATLKGFQQMGLKTEGPLSQKLIIHGLGKHGLQPPEQSIDCGNSGTSMRLLTGLLSAQNFNSRLIGDESLSKRPMERIIRPLSYMGAEIIAKEGRPPLEVHGKSHLKAIRYEMPVASAQVKSALLLAGMYAQGETVIIEKGITRDHTERMLTAFSYPVYKSGKALSIHSGYELKATDIIVPGDISSAAFLIVAACITPGSHIMIKNVGINPTRIGVLKILERMGADLRVINKRLCGEEPVADIEVKYASLEGIDIPQALVPSAIDEFPVIFIAAATARGQTILHGAKELRYKESDRIASMIEGLHALGIEAQAFDDGLFIQGGHFKGGLVNSKGDHRIAMAFAIAGAVSDEPVVVSHCENVQTSFPNFVATVNKIGMNVQEFDDE